MGTIDIDSIRVKSTNSPYLTGSCIEDVNHEIYGGIYSQMVFGESFQEPQAYSTIQGFESFGGDWKCANGVVEIEATNGPKLILQNPDFKKGRASIDLWFFDQKGDNAGLLLRTNEPGKGASLEEQSKVSQSKNYGTRRRAIDSFHGSECDFTSKHDVVAAPARDG